MDKEAVIDRLDFAKRRLIDLEELARNDEDLCGADPKERQQLIQEFFFHLVGAIEFLAQVVNISENIDLSLEDVSISNVCENLNINDPIKPILEKLHPKTRRKPLPNDPYSEEGCLFRIFVYRNRVCHHGRNPFFFRDYIGAPQEEPSTSLLLDPRNTSRDGSKESAISELNQFYKLVHDKCQNVIENL